MKIEDFAFGSIRIDNTAYKDDLVIVNGEVRKRNKQPSRKFRDQFGHTPLSLEEEIPWNCNHLVVGTGVDGKMPVLPEVRREAEKRGVDLIVVPTTAAIERLQKTGHDRETTNAVLHITC